MSGKIVSTQNKFFKLPLILKKQFWGISDHDFIFEFEMEDMEKVIGIVTCKQFNELTGDDKKLYLALTEKGFANIKIVNWNDEGMMILIGVFSG